MLKNVRTSGIGGSPTLSQRCRARANPVPIPQFSSSTLPVILQFFSNSPPVLFQFSSNSPTVLLQFSSSYPPVLLQFSSRSPLVLLQFSSSSPPVLHQFSSSCPPVPLQFPASRERPRSLPESVSLWFKWWKGPPPSGPTSPAQANQPRPAIRTSFVMRLGLYLQRVVALYKHASIKYHLITSVELVT